ncbi:MAG: hypothetical protein HYV03_06565, partial [Deltaproteobacteria bacterium]|nr:hypothetical protein [Deltaproteobacteria bacterium]
TSRYEEPSIRAKCAQLGVRLIPKGLAGFVPIRVEGVAPGAGLKSDTPVQVEPSGYRILLIDDDATIGLAWSVYQKELGIGKLSHFQNLEAVQSQKIDPAQFDCCFVDKNIDHSAYDGAATIAWLRAHGARRIVLASGEAVEELRAGPLAAQVDAICPEKIPAALTPYL